MSLSCPELTVGGCVCRAGEVSGVQPSLLGTCSFLWEANSAEPGVRLQTRQSTWLPHRAMAQEETGAKCAGV